MRSGNKIYSSQFDVPEIVPVFPLTGALLLPGGNMPLNIFEPRYLAMTDAALCADRVIGIIQPDLAGKQSEHGPQLCKMGCLGRLTGFQETGDGRYGINLSGICRFTIVEEIGSTDGYRRARILPQASDFDDNISRGQINRAELLAAFKRYLEANNMDTDWEAVERTDDEPLVTALCMMSPYGPAEKQALLEAVDLKTRADTLVAITEMMLAKNSSDHDTTLQ